MIDAPIATALIALVSALASAVYAGWISSRNSLKLAQIQVELSKQKDLTVEYMRIYINLEIEDRSQALEAHKEYIRHVQLMREQLKRILACPEAYQPEIVERELENLSKTIAESYANHLICLDNHSADNNRTAHALKNDCGKAAKLVRVGLLSDTPNNLPEVEALFDSITEKQELLRQDANQCASYLLDEIRSRIENRNEK